MKAKIMTFNIRYDNPYDGENCWVRRRDFVFEMLQREAPDILCLQEVLPHVKNDLEENLSMYNFCGCGRSTELQDEYNPIGYNRKRFDLLFTDTFWLGSDPKKPGSMNPYSVDLPRICTQVILRDKQEGTVFTVYNTHLDHVSDEARIQGIAVVLDKIAQFGGLPSVIMGDFNALEGSQTYLSATEHFLDAQYVAKESCQSHTFQNWGDPGSFKRIDYFMISKTGFQVERYGVMQPVHDGVYASDHCPIVLQLTLLSGAE